jgi:hypothetical protein
LKQGARAQHRVHIGGNVADQPDDPERPDPLQAFVHPRRNTCAAPRALCGALRPYFGAATTGNNPQINGPWWRDYAHRA